MRALVAINFEVARVTSLLQHICGIATYQHGSVLLKSMVIVQSESIGRWSNSAQIGGYLAVVFAEIFQEQFESSDSYGIE